MIDQAAQEKWLPVIGFEGFYEVSDLGRVRSLDRVQHVVRHDGASYTRKLKGRMLRQPLDSGGYPCVTLWREHTAEQWRVANLVVRTFAGLVDPGEHLARISDRSAVRLDQLLRTDRRVIEAMKADRGTKVQGERTPWAILRDEDVAYIRKNPDGLTQEALAAKFNTTQSRISRVQSGAQWKHLPPDGEQ